MVLLAGQLSLARSVVDAERNLAASRGRRDQNPLSRFHRQRQSGAAGISSIPDHHRSAETLGMSTYNSLQVLVQKRYSVGLHFTVAYTWSKILDDASASQVNAQDSGPMDAYHLSLDKSLSLNDAPHILAIGYSYELRSVGQAVPEPRRRSEGLGNWQFAGMSRYQSGFPLRITGGNALPIFSGNRPTFVDGQPIRTAVGVGDFDPARDRWLNPAAFSNGPLFGFGNVPFTVGARGFPIYEEGAALIKKIPLRERVYVDLRAEFYNVLNRVVFAAPTTGITSTALARWPRRGTAA